MCDLILGLDAFLVFSGDAHQSEYVAGEGFSLLLYKHGSLATSIKRHMANFY